MVTQLSCLRSPSLQSMSPILRKKPQTKIYVHVPDCQVHAYSGVLLHTECKTNTFFLNVKKTTTKKRQRYMGERKDFEGGANRPF